MQEVRKVNIFLNEGIIIWWRARKQVNKFNKTKRLLIKQSEREITPITSTDRHIYSNRTRRQLDV